MLAMAVNEQIRCCSPASHS